MFNVTVLKLKDLIRYFVCLAILTVILYVFSKYFIADINSKEKISSFQERFKIALDNKLINCIRTDYSWDRRYK